MSWQLLCTTLLLAAAANLCIAQVHNVCCTTWCLSDARVTPSVTVCPLQNTNTTTTTITVRFSKQTPRPAPAAITCSPAALGPGAYFRSHAAAVTTSCANTSCNCSCGLSHSHNHRPSTAPCRGHAAAVAVCCPGGQRGTAAEGESCVRTRPSSAALDYARGQRGTVLVPPAAAAGADADSWSPDTSAAASGAGLIACSSQQQQPAEQQQQQQQQLVRFPLRMRSRQQSPAAAAMAAHAPLHSLRPQSAGPLLMGAAVRAVAVHPSAHNSSTRPCSGAQLRRPVSSSTAGVCWGPRGTAAAAAAGGHRPNRPAASAADGGGSRNSSSGGDCIIRAGDAGRFSSAGLADRVKGGRFSTSRRDGAAVGGGAATGSSELLYQPRPEVQGHMHRAPGWTLPPNSVDISKKWARLAAHAALQ